MFGQRFGSHELPVGHEVSAEEDTGLAWHRAKVGWRGQVFFCRHGLLACLQTGWHIESIWISDRNDDSWTPFKYRRWNVGLQGGYQWIFKNTLAKISLYSPFRREHGGGMTWDIPGSGLREGQAPTCRSIAEGRKRAAAGRFAGLCWWGSCGRFGDLRIWCLGMTIWEFIFAGNLKEVWGSSHWFAECWDSILMADQS